MKEFIKIYIIIQSKINQFGKKNRNIIFLNKNWGINWIKTLKIFNIQIYIYNNKIIKNNSKIRKVKCKIKVSLKILSKNKLKDNNEANSKVKIKVDSKIKIKTIVVRKMYVNKRISDFYYNLIE